MFHELGECHLLAGTCIQQCITYIFKFPSFFRNETYAEIYLCLRNLSYHLNLFLFPWLTTLFQANIYISLPFRKCKIDCNLLKTTLVQGFCPLKVEIAEIARFPIGFWLNHLLLMFPYVPVTPIYECVPPLEIYSRPGYNFILLLAE